MSEGTMSRVTAELFNQFRGMNTPLGVKTVIFVL